LVNDSVLDELKLPESFFYVIGVMGVMGVMGEKVIIDCYF
jgi:hypothetical protein